MTDAQFAAATSTGAAILALILWKGYRMFANLKAKVEILRGVVAGLKSDRDVLRSDLDAARARIAELEGASTDLPGIEAGVDGIIASLAPAA